MKNIFTHSIIATALCLMAHQTTLHAQQNNGCLLDSIYTTFTDPYDLPDEYRDYQTYDANNNITEFFSQKWNTATAAWENFSKNTYTYDANNNEQSSCCKNGISPLLHGRTFIKKPIPTMQTIT